MPRLGPLLVSLVVATAFAVPLAIVVVPELETRRQMERLGGDDPAARDQAIAHLAREARDDPGLVKEVASRLRAVPGEAVPPIYAAFASAVDDPGELPDAAVAALPRLEHADFTAVVRLLERQGEARRPPVLDEAAARLDHADDDRFAELYALLERLGGWERPRVSDDAWLRWIEAAMPPAPGVDNTEDGDRPRFATFVADRLGEVPELAGDPRVIAMTDRLLSLPDPAERLAAMPLTVSFIPLHPAYEPMVREMANDEHPEIADAAERVILLLETDSSEPRMSIRRLGLAAHSADGLTSAAPSELTPDNVVGVWRRVLAMDDTAEARAWWRELAAMDLDDLLRRPVALAATYRLGSEALPPIDSDPDALTEHQWKAVLAALEGAEPGSVDLSVPDAMPHVVRPAALRAARDPDPAWLLDTLRLDDRPAARDVAVVTAAEVLPPEGLDLLIETLLKDPDPEGRMSAAMLVGLTGRQIELLEKWRQREQRQAVRLMMGVGLWMTGREPGLGEQLASMLGRAGLPETTLMLAMLNGPASAGVGADDGPGTARLAAVLDRLNAMPEDQRLDLLGTRRWWRVLAPHLPDDAPRLSLWADGTLARDQLADLRVWSWLHRYDGAAFSR